jgi:acetyl esterase/lipase
MKRLALSYGPHRNQTADLWRPGATNGPLPAVVLIHGGFWRQLYTKRLMHRLASALVAHGWAAYNIEYRRVGHLGSGGWPQTFDDASAALDALGQVEGIDRDRIVTCGHSAGGHLALWLASSRVTGSPREPVANRVAVRTAISLAGVPDLVAAARSGLGGGAATALMGGGPDEFPQRYALGSPEQLLPMGVPQVLVHGLADSTVPPSYSADYVELARAKGDAATYVPLPGVSHMAMIDPGSSAFTAITECLDGIG